MPEFKKSAKVQAPAKDKTFTKKKVSGTAFPEKLERANKLLTSAVLKRKVAVSH
jgi:hypothetical protein